MGRLLLAAVYMWTSLLTVTPLIDEQQVRRVKSYIDERFTMKFGKQFAYVVKFTEDECKKNLSKQVIEEALRYESKERMAKEVARDSIYEGHRMVLSTYQKCEKCRRRSYSLHAEYRLLDGDFSSPVSRLLLKQPFAQCTIFYSLNSPCTSKCLNPDGRYYIIHKLSGLFPDDKVFAFTEVFHRDTGERNLPIVRRRWGNLNSNQHLYRCTEYQCFQCFQNGALRNECHQSPWYRHNRLI
ncbi:uncharacterized protein [Phyllobates terribilis]|uniref:uncharacterized protein n=1 Tax=Phyllobates terribilis TaxID=111132 RepID=UPI003CCAE753